MSRTQGRDEQPTPALGLMVKAAVLSLPLVVAGCAGSPTTSVPGLPTPPSASIPTSIPSPSSPSSRSGKSGPSGDKSSSDSKGDASDKSTSSDSDSSSSGQDGVEGPELPSAGGGIPWPSEDSGSPGGDVASKEKGDGDTAGDKEFPGDKFPGDEFPDSEEGTPGSEDGDLSRGAGGEEEVADSDASTSSRGSPGGTEDGDFSSDVDLTLEDVPLLEDGIREVLDDPEGELAEAVLEEILEKANLPSIPGLPGDEGLGLPGREGSGLPGRDGPLTPAEQVAVLDAELDRSAGDFDDMILDEQDRQREQTPTAGRLPQAQAEQDMEDASQGDGNSPIGSNMPGRKNPVDVARADIPQNTARFPPPEDIPSGNNDDVVARQLREAAMREPDPELREKLWDEYRKYKGISK